MKTQNFPVFASSDFINIGGKASASCLNVGGSNKKEVFLKLCQKVLCNKRKRRMKRNFPSFFNKTKHCLFNSNFCRNGKREEILINFVLDVKLENSGRNEHKISEFLEGHVTDKCSVVFKFLGFNGFCGLMLC